MVHRAGFGPRPGRGLSIFSDGRRQAARTARGEEEGQAEGEATMMRRVVTQPHEERLKRLRTLEAEIRKHYEAYVQTGFALKEIRDDFLYKEDGFTSWENYLRERVGEQFGIEKTQANKLIACAQIREKMPDNPGSMNTAAVNGQPWSQNAVHELARLAPKDEGNYNFDKLRERDVERVAKKAVEEAREQGLEMPTAPIVRRIVDEELGIDRAANDECARELEKRREEEVRPLLHEWLTAQTQLLYDMTKKLSSVPDGGWLALDGRNPEVLDNWHRSGKELLELLNRVELLVFAQRASSRCRK
jgi:hypothetical protein